MLRITSGALFRGQSHALMLNLNHVLANPSRVLCSDGWLRRCLDLRAVHGPKRNAIRTSRDAALYEYEVPGTDIQFERTTAPKMILADECLRDLASSRFVGTTGAFRPSVR